MTMAFRRAAHLDDVWSGEKAGVLVDGRRVLLVNVEGVLKAYLDRCAHQGVRLSEGKLDGCMLVCAAHGWQYDARTGAGINPRAARLAPLPLRIEGGEIFVDVDAPDARAEPR
jgi:toluene monooxygenase system ferredoxin subunit